MITLVEKSSAVRHACYEALIAAGFHVSVFCSVESFVNTGALFGTDLLIIGKASTPLHECEAFLWASKVRPELKAYCLNGRCSDLRYLSQLCEEAVFAAHTDVLSIDIDHLAVPLIYGFVKSTILQD